MAVTESNCVNQYPLTIFQWRTLQESQSGPTLILSLLERIRSDTSNAWISLATEAQIVKQWEYITSLHSQGRKLPLFGVPFAVKDNIAVAGFYTTAGCPSFGKERATADSTVVKRLKEHGAIVVGKTNMDQFATGLVGTRSPYGVVANVFDPERVSGGSSSGSGVVVSRGLVPFALGTDTAGSGRVPAGFNNVIGLKPTRGALSTLGVVPACRSLDCVSIFALILEDSELVLQLAEGLDLHDAYSRARPYYSSQKTSFSNLQRQPIIAICFNPEWFGDSEHAAAYATALANAKQLGWKLETVNFEPLFTLANLLYEGPWVAERYAAIKDFFHSVSAQDMDPVVRNIISQAEQFSAVDVFQSEYRRKELSRQIEQSFTRFDGILVPTTPTFPTIQEVKDEPVLANSRLGIYTNFVNLMDWSALAIPAGFRGDGLPFGMTLISGPWKEPRLLELSRQWLSQAPRRLGATNITYHESLLKLLHDFNSIPLAVVGAHLSGLPLNKDLVLLGADLESVTTTAPCYQLFALEMESAVRKPALKRVAVAGASIEVEVWNMPLKGMGSFLSTVHSPLGIGSIELQDGRWVHGFICEPIGLSSAKDITRFGSWRNYVQSLKESSDQQWLFVKGGVSWRDALNSLESIPATTQGRSLPQKSFMKR